MKNTITMKRTLGIATTACVVLCGLVFPSHASITRGEITGGDAKSRGGFFIRLTPPIPNPFGGTNSVGNNTFEKPNLYGFDENQNFIAGKPLQIDLLNTGKPGTLPPRAEVASHYVFYDPPPGIPRMIGYVDFSDEIVGVITHRQNLIDSDYLAHTGVNYLSPGKRGLESDDSVRIDRSNPKRLHVDFGASTPGDYIRVLTRRPASSRTRWSVNGHYYEPVLAQGGITWSNANAIAISRGGYLAHIESEAENEFVFQLLQNREFWRGNGPRNWLGPWIGGFRGIGASGSPDVWFWETGKPIAFAHWAPDQPNNVGGNENRIQFMGQGDIGNFWNDLPAENSQHALGFVIEYEANPKPFPVLLRGAQQRVILQWRSQLSRTYSIRKAQNLAAPSWSVVTHLFGTGEPMALEFESNGTTEFFEVSDSLDPE